MRIAVIGGGVMGRNHARGVRTLGHTLTGIVDAASDVAQGLASTHETKSFTTLDALFDAAPETEALIVATPTATHEAVVLEAFDRGAHVLVEKPIAHDPRAASRMIAAARDAGKVLAVGHIERHNPVVDFAKRALDEHRFGRPITLATRRVSSYPGRIRDVGCILDIGIHDIDVLNYLAGSPPDSVYALGGRHASDADVEDHANLLLSYPQGITGSVEVNWLTPRKVRRLSLTCDEAFVEADYMDQSITISRSTYGNINEGDLSQIPIETHVESITLQRDEPLLRELTDFVNAASTGKGPLADGPVGLQAILVADAALRSMTSGKREAPARLEAEV